MPLSVARTRRTRRPIPMVSCPIPRITIGVLHDSPALFNFIFDRDVSALSQRHDRSDIQYRRGRGDITFGCAARNTAKIKKHLPLRTRYKWKDQASQGDWTWNVVSIRGGVEYSGVAVFANDRANYARLRLASNSVERKKLIKTATAWRVADQLHSAYMFLGDERKTYNAATIDHETKRQMDTLRRLLGKPASKDHETYGSGPEDAGWTATWKLSHGRELYYAETLTLLDSAIRPSLELTFSYSQMYCS